MIGQLGEPYVTALRTAWPTISDAADFVMFWWLRAAERVASGSVRRFGLVTTNSITMGFNRSIVEKCLSSKSPISIVSAIPDHPWSIGDGAAAVRIAMTVATAGKALRGVVQTVKNVRPGHADSEALTEPVAGVINGFLKTGVRLDDSKPLIANAGLSYMGVIPVCLNFVVTDAEVQFLGFNSKSPPSIIKSYLGGKDLADNRPARKIIDLFGLSEAAARASYPAAYQYVLENVKPFRDGVNRKNHRENWWIFGEARPGMRQAFHGLARYIATTETSKHRWFTTLETKILPDQKIRVIASADDYLLGILSSRFHVVWATAIGGRVGKGNDPVYNNTVCFDPFPFPSATDEQKSRIADIARELDDTRKRVQKAHPELTLTHLYNVLEKLKADIVLTERETEIKNDGLVPTIGELHAQLDALAASAYGWPNDLTDEDILARLVGLNSERTQEEAKGQIRWLRPEFQIAKASKTSRATTGELDLGQIVVPVDASLPTFPGDRYEQPLAIEAVLLSSGLPMNATQLARTFKRGGKRIEPRIAQVLTTLVRYGRVVATGDGKFFARRAA
jgi:hypothetical protein